MTNLFKDLKNPKNVYRPAPLWAWNGNMTESIIDKTLEELSSLGFGGAFVHPRPGLVTEYLSDAWFSLWGYALKKAKSLGLKLYIYDENSYPSGFAGGNVSAKLPDCLANGMAYKISEDPASEHFEKIAVFALSDDEKEITSDLKGVSESEYKKYSNKFFVIYKVPAEASAWLGGLAYPDVLRKEVTDEFLSCTHEAYYKHFGKDFGKAVPAIFTDEPYPANGSVISELHALPFSFYFAGEFLKLKGYDLIKNLPLVFLNIKGKFDHPAEKVRFDFYDVIHTLWTKNSIEPISNWCKEHGINFTGHYFEHMWPLASVFTSPVCQSNYEFHSWPAIDMLFSDYLKSTPSHPLTLTIRELMSASNTERAVGTPISTIINAWRTGSW